MIQLNKIENLDHHKNLNKKIEFVFMGWEEPNKGQELSYYILLIDQIDKNQRIVFIRYNSMCYKQKN